MQRIQKHLQTINRLLVLTVMCGLFFSIPPTAQGFLARTSKALDILLDKIDRPQWKIGYNFTVDCPDAFRQQEEQLKEVITKALQDLATAAAGAVPEQAVYRRLSFTKTAGCCGV